MAGCDDTNSRPYHNFTKVIGMATVAPQADIAETASVFGIATEQKLLLVRH